MVTPFALIAATPVGATTTILFNDAAFTLCKKVVFPVPALPVIKRFLSVFSINWRARSSSAFLGISAFCSKIPNYRLFAKKKIYV